MVLIHSHRSPCRISGARPGSSARWSENLCDPPRSEVDCCVRDAVRGELQPLQYGRRLCLVDRPLLSLLAPGAPVRSVGRQVDVDGAGMGMASQAIQPAESLRKRAHAASLGNKVFGVDVGTHLQGLRSDHDEMALPPLG